ETPPQAWGRPRGDEKDAKWHRNTPTGVGKTENAHRTGQAQGETPPQAWGRHQQIVNERSARHKICQLRLLQGFNNQLQAGYCFDRFSRWTDGPYLVAGRLA